MTANVVSGFFFADKYCVLVYALSYSFSLLSTTSKGKSSCETCNKYQLPLLTWCFHRFKYAQDLTFQQCINQSCVTKLHRKFQCIQYSHILRYSWDSLRYIIAIFSFFVDSIWTTILCKRGSGWGKYWNRICRQIPSSIERPTGWPLYRETRKICYFLPLPSAWLAPTRYATIISYFYHSVVVS